ncbi:periplasmic heavy metal sensor [Mesobacterium pallidum]|uniref:periplasmic heavy metal sensor n=1 Tax=Mesobacterium pallidum TaxID=2872037 RepID=UPI001EE37348|nr:periplasmic heavy metal sensor [Mesobacterium pallidum]
MSDPTTDTPTRTGMKPWLKAVLFASLALNLAVLGLVIGAVLHGPPGGPDGPDRDRGTVGMAFPYTKAFPPEARDELRRDFGDRMRAERESRGAREPTFPEVLVLLRAEPFDREAFDAVLQRQYARVAETQAVGRAVLIDRIAAMSAADRAAYADRLEEALNRRRDHPHKDKDRDDR